MKQLAELMKSVTPLREYSKGVALAMSCVALVADKDNAGIIIFPEKKIVFVTLAGASWKLTHLAEQLKRLLAEVVQPDQSIPAHSNGCYLSFSRREAKPRLSYLQIHHRELGEIMDAMSVDNDQIGEEDYQRMLKRLALKHRTIDEILDAAKDRLHLPSNHFFNFPEKQQKCPKIACRADF